MGGEERVLDIEGDWSLETLSKVLPLGWLVEFPGLFEGEGVGMTRESILANQEIARAGRTETLLGLYDELLIRLGPARMREVGPNLCVFRSNVITRVLTPALATIGMQIHDPQHPYAEKLAELVGDQGFLDAARGAYKGQLASEVAYQGEINQTRPWREILAELVGQDECNLLVRQLLVLDGVVATKRRLGSKLMEEMGEGADSLLHERWQMLAGLKEQGLTRQERVSRIKFALKLLRKSFDIQKTIRLAESQRPIRPDEVRAVFSIGEIVKRVILLKQGKIDKEIARGEIGELLVPALTDVHEDDLVGYRTEMVAKVLGNEQYAEWKKVKGINETLIIGSRKK